MYIKVCMLLVALFSGVALAELPGVLRWEVERDMEATYKAVYELSLIHISEPTRPTT